jgi:predicted Zn-dependent protease
VRVLVEVERRLRDVVPNADLWSLRIVYERNQVLSVRKNVVEPPQTSEDLGVMITMFASGFAGYAGTCDLTSQGLRQAAERALQWAKRGAAWRAYDASKLPRDPIEGEYQSSVRIPWESVKLSEKIDLLRRQCERLKVDDRILDWQASLWHTDVQVLYVTSAGTRIHQSFEYLLPTASVTANKGNQTQTRTFGGHAYARQGGLEIVDDLKFWDAASRIGEQAVELLAAPNCPTGKLDLLLAPDQMILQIHESIGHPLELDRILGDERNYAGTSFVTPEMIGTYRYGSELLNVVFDPTRPEQLATYAFDDEGQPARREYIVRNGILLRPLGSLTSQVRSGLPGVANARASGWNRPPIDRMANLNLEPANASLEDMITSVERGVYMETNSSWSIDDSRNKFQFGCEWARLIENGRLTSVVKNPNYRGISANFWRSLAMVGDESTIEVLGTPYCGKGEPNQIMRVGHASPACLFRDADVFGGV